MYQYLGTPVDHERLAREACEIEIDMLGKPIGVQDQYIAAYGGQRFIHFCRNGHINVEMLRLEETVVRKLNQNLLLFYTNVARKAESVLAEQVQNIDARRHVLCEMKQLAIQARDCLRANEMDEFGRLLDQSWSLKKQLASKISNDVIDDCTALHGALAHWVAKLRAQVAVVSCCSIAPPPSKMMYAAPFRT